MMTQTTETCQSIRSPETDTRRLLRLSLLCALGWGLLAHAYAYLHDMFSHDSLMIYADGREEVWKVRLGRILVPAYRFLTRGGIEVPWLIGLMSLLWLGLALFLVAQTFRIRSPLALALTAGVMVTNVTVTAITATYLFELDFDMLSVLLSALAVWLWKHKKYGFLWGSLCICGTLGFYQCNISVAVVLIMMDCILSFLRGEDTWETLRRGLLGMAMIALGGVLYLLALRAVLAMTQIELAKTYNSIGNAFSSKSTPLPELVRKAYADALEKNLLLQERIPRYRVFILPLCAVTAAGLVRTAWLKRPKALNLAAALVLLLLLPLGANLSYVMNDGRAHDLMKYAVWLLLLLPVLLFSAVPELERGTRPALRALAAVLLALALFQNVVLSNTLYIKKDLEHDATLSYMTRVADALYEVEGYEPGVTRVCVVGTPRVGVKMYGFEPYYSFTGQYSGSAATYYETVVNYIRYVLNLKIELVSDAEQKQIAAKETVQQMPCFPAEGSIQWVDEDVVIRVG